MLDHLDHTAAAQLVIDPTATASQALTAGRLRRRARLHLRWWLGYADHAPYDRMIVTVAQWDIPAQRWNSSRLEDGWSSSSLPATSARVRRRSTAAQGGDCPAHATRQE
jgi:hypothetical protein